MRRKPPLTLHDAEEAHRVHAAAGGDMRHRCQSVHCRRLLRRAAAPTQPFRGRPLSLFLSLSHWLSASIGICDHTPTECACNTLAGDVDESDREWQKRKRERRRKIEEE